MPKEGRSHFNDLCALVGHDTPVPADKTGASFTFERGAAERIRYRVALQAHALATHSPTRKLVSVCVCRSN